MLEWTTSTHTVMMSVGVGMAIGMRPIDHAFPSPKRKHWRDGVSLKSIPAA